jgi:hypothetical protein
MFSVSGAKGRGFSRRGLLGRALVGLAGLRALGSVGPVVSAPSGPVELVATSVRVSRLPAAGLLVASGGVCPPLSPVYELPNFASRPVTEALPSFEVRRGDVELD